MLAGTMGIVLDIGFDDLRGTSLISVAELNLITFIIMIDSFHEQSEG